MKHIKRKSNKSKKDNRRVCKKCYQYKCICKSIYKFKKDKNNDCLKFQVPWVNFNGLNKCGRNYDYFDCIVFIDNHNL